MIRYHFDLYPRDDPKDGTLLVRFTKLQSAEYRGEANGTGAGRFSLRADTADAGFIDPRGLQYVRVVREDTVAVTEAVVGGFFLDNGDFTALDDNGTRLLVFGGAGTLSYLARAVMAPHTYISPIFTGQDPFDDIWRLYAQSTVYANGNYLGAMLWRVIYEAQHFTPGSHRHADGITVTDTHANDRTVNALPALTIGFDQFDDSSAAAWTASSGEFKAQIGENVLQVIRRLMEAGLYLSMDPDTFELDAWQAAGHGRTRTGGAWGAAVIRFQAPSAGTVDTGNIKSDAKRGIAAFVKRSLLWAGGSDVYAKSTTGGSDIPWEGFYPSDASDATALGAIATVQLGARSDAGDTLRLRMKLDASPTTGKYLPFESAGVLLDDTVTVHTGTGQWDYNEDTFPVAALTVALRKGGDWDAWADLGSTYTSMAERAFQARGAIGPPNPSTLLLCVPSTLGTAEIVAVYEDWTFGTDPTPVDTLIANPLTAGAEAFGGGAVYDEPNDGFGDVGTTATHIFAPNSAGSGRVLCAAFTTYRFAVRHARYSGTFKIVVQWFNSTGDQISASIIAPVTTWPAVWSDSTGDATAPAGAVSMEIQKLTSIDGAAAFFVDRVTISTVVAGGAGTLGDGHPDLIGTSTRAKRCDDTEHYHTTADPTVDDDTSSGFRNGTLWINESTGAMFLLLDNAEGAADWLAVGGAGDLSGIDFLVGTASGDLSAEIVVGATPGGELGGTWAAPTVDATHSGSTHSASTDTHIADTSDAHDASAVSVLDTAANFTGTDVEAVLAELYIAAGSSSSGGSASVTRVTRSTNQSIADVTITAISWDTEDRDADGMWVIGSPTRLTCTLAGEFLVTAAALHVGATGGIQRQLRLHVNGVEHNTEIASPDANAQTILVAGVVNLVVGDYIELAAYQDSGVSRDLVSNGGKTLWASVTRLPSSVPFSNYAATAAPTVNEDSGDGYSVGSIWINVTTDTGYQCMDATVGAAVWKQTTA